MQIAIYVEVEEEDEYADPNHKMGITNEAFDLLGGALSWLGEVQDVKKLKVEIL